MDGNKKRMITPDMLPPKKNNHIILTKRITLLEDLMIPKGTPTTGPLTLDMDRVIPAGEKILLYKTGYVAVTHEGQLYKIAHLQFSGQIWVRAHQVDHHIEENLDEEIEKIERGTNPLTVVKNEQKKDTESEQG